MKRLLVLVLMAMMLLGCTGKSSNVDRALLLRQKILSGQGVSFDAAITADYGNEVYSFKLHCISDEKGDISFSVLEPESISGISGMISNGGADITFDDKVLGFSILSEELPTPVSAPWILIKTLRGGYLNACTPDQGGFRISIDDSYESDPLHLEIWVDEYDIPTAAEIYWNGSRIVSLEVSNFSYL